MGLADKVSAPVTESAVADAGFEFDPLAGTAVVRIGEYHPDSIAPSTDKSRCSADLRTLADSPRT